MKFSIVRTYSENLPDALDGWLEKGDMLQIEQTPTNVYVHVNGITLLRIGTKNGEVSLAAPIPAFTHEEETE